MWHFDIGVLGENIDAEVMWIALHYTRYFYQCPTSIKLSILINNNSNFQIPLPETPTSLNQNLITVTMANTKFIVKKKSEHK